MARVMIGGYPHRLGGHCGSASLRDLIDWAGLGWDGPPGEALVFGLAGGLSFHWMSIPEVSPLLYLGGRGGDMELDLCGRLGVAVERRQTEDPAEGWAWVTRELDAGRPVMVWAEILQLPYLRVRLSNTRHALVIVGYDTEAGVAYVADNDREEIQEVPLDALAKARDSDGFPGRNRHATYPMRFPDSLPELLPAAREAAAGSAARLRGDDDLSGLLPENISDAHGLEGISRFTTGLADWPRDLAPDDLSRLYRSLAVYIEKAGTGGALFRRLQSGFCRDVAALTGDPFFGEAAHAYAACAETWSALASAVTAPNPDHATIARTAAALPALEEQALETLAAAGGQP